jgi:hypothetical protein
VGGQQTGFPLAKEVDDARQDSGGKNFLKSREVLVFGIKPANGHFQDFGDAAHELIVWGVFAPAHIDSSGRLRTWGQSRQVCQVFLETGRHEGGLV